MLMRKLLYGLMQSRLYYVSTWLKIGIAQRLLVKVSSVEF
jgi:hypothetical protein